MSSQMALDSLYIIFCHLCTLLCRPLQGRKTRRREIAENVNYEGKNFHVNPVGNECRLLHV